VAILEELGWGMAGNGYGSGDVIIGGEGCGGGEGGAEDTDVVVEGGRGAGTVVEEGKFVLRADIKGSEGHGRREVSTGGGVDSWEVGCVGKGVGE